MKRQFSFPKDRIRILLLEDVHPAALDSFKDAGYSSIEQHKSAFSEDQLLQALPGVHILGIRSKTQLTSRVLSAGKQLLAVGCFCIGTDQVDLAAACQNGVAVFNAPFSNTRSVAELAMAEVVMLARQAAQRSLELHQGRWLKTAKSCVEVRNKTLGIVGYGHIGPQVGLLAEAFGMEVVFFDIVKKLALGTARQLPALEDLLAVSDFVTLHVPETPLTRGMMNADRLKLMKPGAYLLNLSRGAVVDLEALRDALNQGRLAGAAVDVYPEEPLANNDPFECALRGVPNVILTPHIGGSTREAQHDIGIETATSLIKYTDTGSSTGSVNFPQIELPLLQDSHRLLNVHRDVPGVLHQINGLVAGMGANIKSQFLGTLNGIGYLIMDVDQRLSRAIKEKIDGLDTSIRTRLLF